MAEAEQQFEDRMREALKADGWTDEQITVLLAEEGGLALMLGLDDAA